MILLGNLPGRTRKHKGYYGPSILKNSMDIEVNLVNKGENNCAKCNAEMVLPGGRCGSGFSLGLLSWPTKCREMSATYS